MKVLNMIARSYFVLALCALMTAGEQDANNETLLASAEDQLPRETTTTRPGSESTAADPSDGETRTETISAGTTVNEEGTTTEEEPTTTRTPIPSEDVETPDRASRVEGTSADLRRSKQLEECACAEGRPPLEPAAECAGGRTAGDCPCRPVCARMAGESCSASSPCDAEFGLRCNSQNNTCQGPLSIEVSEVTSHSARIRWYSSESELQPQALVFYTSTYRGQHATQWTKINGVKPFVEVEDLLPSRSYFVKVEEDGKQEITTFRTKDNMFGNMPKILVKQRSQTTLTVVWDDFRLPSYHSEYILEYRPSADDNRNWTKVQAGTQTIVSLSNLRPNTPYDLKVAVWEDDKLELPSEVITAYTADGCVKDNRPYNVGEEYLVGCDSRCVCRGSNQTTCEPRCSPPSLSKGRTLDPLCYEKPSPSDPCCVTLRCTESKFYGDSKESKNKSGECPEIIEESESESKSCMSDCDHDGDCTDNLKCCPSSCGGAVCVLPEDVCEHIYCGPNAECVSEKKTCECSKGYHGDPHDFLTGCVWVNSTYSSAPDSPPKVDPGTRESHKMKHDEPGIIAESKNELEDFESSSKDLPSTKAPFRLDFTSRSNQTGEVEGGEAAEMPSDEENFHLRRPQDPLEGIRDGNQSTTADVPVLFDGCEFNNVTYDRGMQFEDGCEARCTCEGRGHMSCVPRCRALGSGGSPVCSEQPDPDDPCCRIMVCSFPASMERNVTILSALAQSGTHVRVRVGMSPLALAQQGFTEVWLSTSASPRQWDRSPLPQQITDVGEGVLEFDLQNLAPSTEYFLRLHSNSSTDEFSNTVSVKTFPAAVTGVQEVCIHHNHTYVLGEAFFEGCEHRCVCREEGLVECQDRCEVYIDTVGYEGCDWVPSEEDPCCTIPMCRRKIPLMPGVPFTGASDNICIVGEGEMYRVGDIWESGDGCKTQICRCTLLSNGSTGVQCTSECPPLAPNAHVPTARCPHPVLVKPDGPCACPYVLCNDVPRRPPMQEAVPQCEFKGRRYAVGEEFHDGCVAACHCGRDLRVSCAAIECPYHFSSEYSSCLQWDIDPNFFPTPPHCCAPAKCINDGSCSFSSKRFENFEAIPTELLPCGSRCVCVNSNVTCENRCTPVEDAPPSTLPCPPDLAFRGKGEDGCCMRWMCPPQQVSAPSCMFQGVRHLLSERWEAGQKSCSCLPGGEEGPRVECGCPSVPQRFLLPTEQCPRPVTVTPEDPLMCPYVVCNNTVSGQELHSVNVVALNSTAVRVRFSLSSLLVGLAGHAELYFTADPTLPPAQWHIQKFSRPKRLFDSPNIEYVLNALRPNTTYFLRVRIRVDALQGGPESELFKLTMPEDAATPPPTVTLDACVEAHVIDTQTVRISWRSFDSSEKRLLYALRLQYRLRGEGEVWTTTPLIHRDVTSYFLHSLRPASDYVLQLLFTPPKDARTKVVSTQSLEFRTAEETKSDYHLQVSVDQVEQDKTSFSFVGIPEPISKYVHVIKILYKGIADGEQLYSFKVPKTTHIMLGDLKPGKKYVSQLELYLTNGHTLTSNEVEFNTKQAENISSSQNVILQESNGKQAELLQSDSGGSEHRAYFIALVVVAVVAAVAAFGFVLLLVLLVRRQASAKAPISRTPSESAYDNPTYKTYDGERPEDKTNGQMMQTTQA